MLRGRSSHRGHPARAMDFLKPTAEHVALYVRFWIGFLFPPAAPLKRYDQPR